MTIQFTEHTQVRAVWFVGGSDRDWLCTLLREPPGEWKARYRFRYYGDDHKAFDSDDRKNWYTATFSHGVEDAERVADDLAASIAAEFGGPVDKLEVRGDGRKAVQMLSEADFAHTRESSVN